MSKFVKLFLVIFALMPSTMAQAQIFDYDGIYLTQDGNQAIQGFNFDQENNEIYVHLNEKMQMSYTQLENTQRVMNIRSYIEANYDFEKMTKDEMTEFNADNGMDYAGALENIANRGLEQNEHWEDLMNQQIPGIYQISQHHSSSRTSRHTDFQMIFINQPKIRFNQNMWEVSMFDIRTPVLRFQASQDLTTITDDFGVTYEKQE